MDSFVTEQWNFYSFIDISIRRPLIEFSANFSERRIMQMHTHSTAAIQIDEKKIESSQLRESTRTHKRVDNKLTKKKPTQRFFSVRQ